MPSEPVLPAELVRLRQEVERQHRACDITGPQGEVDWKTGYKAALGWVLFRMDGLLIDGGGA